MNPTFILLVVASAIVVFLVALTKPARESVPVLLGLAGAAGLCWFVWRYASVIGDCIVLWFLFRMHTRPRDEADSMLIASLAHYADPSISETGAYNFHDMTR